MMYTNIKHTLNQPLYIIDAVLESGKKITEGIETAFKHDEAQQCLGWQILGLVPVRWVCIVNSTPAHYVFTMITTIRQRLYRLSSKVTATWHQSVPRVIRGRSHMPTIFTIEWLKIKRCRANKPTSLNSTDFIYTTVYNVGSYGITIAGWDNGRALS